MKVYFGNFTPGIHFNTVPPDLNLKIGEVLEHLGEEPRIEARRLGKKSTIGEVLEHLGEEPRIEARRLASG